MAVDGVPPDTGTSSHPDARLGARAVATRPLDLGRYQQEPTHGSRVPLAGGETDAEVAVVSGSAGPLHVRVSGSFARVDEAVLLVHPANLQAASWAAVIEGLKESTVCVAPDLRGHGGSHRSADGAYSVADWADDCSAVLDAFALNRVHLVGASVGAAVVVELAARRPREIATVATIGGAFVPGTGSGAALLNALHALGPAAALRRHVADDALAQDAAAELVDAVVGDLSENDAATVAAIWRAAQATDVRPHLNNLDAPCLAVVGESDRTCPPDESRWFALQTGARFEQLPGVGHLPMYESPADVAALIAEHANLTLKGSSIG
jgi:3-oxoadipate enol-lactonase